MPYIDVKLTGNTDENQKNELQNKLTDAVCSAFGKPKSFVMVNIDDNKSLYMGSNILNNGAYIAVSLFGNASKSSCQILTKNICNILQNDLSVSPSQTYVTYHPVDLWGWNETMF